MLERWTRAVVRFRYAVLVCWLAVAIVGIFAAVGLPPLLTTSLVVPGTSSDRANTILAQHFDENPEGTFTVVFRTGGTSALMMSSLARRLAGAAGALPGAHATALHT